MTTTRFNGITAEMAATMGMADLRVVEVGHPLGGTDEATILRWADAAVDETLRLLTAAP